MADSTEMDWEYTNVPTDFTKLFPKRKAFSFKDKAPESPYLKAWYQMIRNDRNLLESWSEVFQENPQIRRSVFANRHFGPFNLSVEELLTKMSTGRSHKVENDVIFDNMMDKLSMKFGDMSLSSPQNSTQEVTYQPSAEYVAHMFEQLRDQKATGPKFKKWIDETNSERPSFEAKRCPLETYKDNEAFESDMDKLSSQLENWCGVHYGFVMLGCPDPANDKDVEMMDAGMSDWPILNNDDVEMTDLGISDDPILDNDDVEMMDISPDQSHSTSVITPSPAVSTQQTHIIQSAVTPTSNGAASVNTSTNQQSLGTTPQTTVFSAASTACNTQSPPNQAQIVSSPTAPSSLACEVSTFSGPTSSPQGPRETSTSQSKGSLPTPPPTPEEPVVPETSKTVVVEDSATNQNETLSSSTPSEDKPVVSMSSQNVLQVPTATPQTEQRLSTSAERQQLNLNSNDAGVEYLTSTHDEQLSVPASVEKTAVANTKGQVSGAQSSESSKAEEKEMLPVKAPESPQALVPTPTPQAASQSADAVSSGAQRSPSPADIPPIEAQVGSQSSTLGPSAVEASAKPAVIPSNGAQAASKRPLSESSSSQSTLMPATPQSSAGQGASHRFVLRAMGAKCGSKSAATPPIEEERKLKRPGSGLKKAQAKPKPTAQFDDGARKTSSPISSLIASISNETKQIPEGQVPSPALMAFAKRADKHGPDYGSSCVKPVQVRYLDKPSDYQRHH